MEFILVCTLWLVVLCGVVWCASELGRYISAFYRSWQQERRYWRSVRSVPELKRVCGRIKARSLGELRVTKHVHPRIEED
jgi:hypothetical protein